ncbi:RagB/SusD family nutrient uptake outer membrane protein [Mucilaginibacter angelicae]|uniref:RagB/SusD family nutrient uptake outer membrane protein n=1 Tax=Mucilaginibacter angelicae TaxID=869718 RepID=A0ABV6KZY7_9SPHI
MKHLKKITLISALFASAMLPSCKKYLDQVPDDRQTIEEVFQKKGPTEQYLANVYSFIKDEGDQWGVNYWVGNTDEMEIAWAKHPIYRLNVGNWSAADAPLHTWPEYYQGVRSATYFINHIDGNKEILALNGQKLIDQYKAEARFLRAYFYSQLMKQYGPVVIIGDKELPVDAALSDLQLARSPYDVCVNYLSSELDEAAKFLPLVPAEDRDYGRISKGAALALKARMLLYDASPEFNGNTTWSGFKNADGTNLISQTFDREKWKKAADAAKAVIDLGIYDLYKDPGNNPIKSYRGAHLVPWNSESIFVKKNNNMWYWDIHASIRAAGGWNGLGPTQELVDAYLMKDGKSITESPLYNENGYTNNIRNMYVNREPRFYASIQFNGMKFKGGAVTGDSVNLEFNFTGRDGKKNGGEDYSHTGYLVFKDVSPETNRLTNQNASRPQVMIRLAEMYLNYAEALAEYGGNDAEAVKYVNLIRERAGIPQYGAGPNQLPVPAGANLIRAIRAERRIELAFEQHRWFDVRRWKTVAGIMGNLHGMNVENDGDGFYQRVVVGNHLWKENYYFFPIQQSEIDRDKLMVQNPGW